MGVLVQCDPALFLLHLTHLMRHPSKAPGNVICRHAREVHFGILAAQLRRLNDLARVLCVSARLMTCGRRVSGM